MLEPLVPPRAGRALNVVGAALCAFAGLLASTVTTVNGVVPIVFLAPPLALAFATRAGGLSYAISRGRGVMPWAPRVVSWVLFGLAALLIGLSGSKYAIAACAAFIVLDLAAGYGKREVAAKEAKERRPFPYKRVLLVTAAIAYAGLVVAFQLTFARYLSQGQLLTWSLIALGFAVALRIWLGGSRAGQAWLFAPVDHKRHERRVERVVDPKRARAEDLLQAFKARGDAGPFLAFVRESARAADLPVEDVQTLERRIIQSFARAGTNRDADVRAALDQVEEFLSLRKSNVEIRP